MDNYPTIQSFVDQSIERSGKLAVQETANKMRDMNTLVSTAAGTALANYIESGNPKFLDALKSLNQQDNVSKNDFIALFNAVEAPQQT